MVDLTSYNTFGVPARADSMESVDNMAALERILENLQKNATPFFVLGSGANILFVGDFVGCILRLTNTDLEIIGEDAEQVRLCVGAGYDWDRFVAWTTEQKYWGAELLSGIPGTVGATPVQNIGAYGAEVSEILTGVEVLEVSSGKQRYFDVKELGLGYRTSRFKREWKGRYIVHHVFFTLQKQCVLPSKYGRLGIEVNPKEPARAREAVLAIRASKLPEISQLGSAGSFFKNPEVEQRTLELLQARFEKIPYYTTDRKNYYKLSAGWLIEQCGWKGYRWGNTGVYEKQALVLVNYGGASGAEILALSEEIAADVAAKMGVVLEREVEVVVGKQ